MIELFAEEVGSGYELGQLKGRRPGPGWPLEPDCAMRWLGGHTPWASPSLSSLQALRQTYRRAQRSDGVPFVGGRPPLPFSQTTLPAD